MPGNSTDTRIVQMQFDNRSFEKNITKSGKSLDKFKGKLNFKDCEKSLDQFSKATRNLTFDSMAENLQKLTDKFTGLGTVSEYIISRVRHGLENAAASAKRFFDSMTIDQINVGFEKFGKLNKNVQTIMAATGRSEEDVYSVMKRLNEYTDQTSYNFTDMASNIGKFTSVGIPLEEAEKQMEGIANWAARSGGSIQEASRAMYNLSQAMGVGALTKIDWKSIENAGMATKEFKEQLIQAGVEVGTLEQKTRKNSKGELESYYVTAKKLGKQVEVNYKNLAETLSKKWADTSTMQKSFMAYYYDDLYYEVEDTAMKVSDEQKKIIEKTLADDSKINAIEWKSLESQKLATEEVKEAALEAAVAQGNLVKETTKDGQTIYKTAAKYGKQMEVTMDNFQESLKTGWLDRGIAKNVWAFDTLAKSAYESAQKCTTFVDVLDAWRDQISTGWMQSFQLIFGNLSESMELFSNICNKVGEALGNLIEIRNRVLDNWVANGGRDSLWSMLVGEVTDGGEVVAYEGAYGFLDVMMDIGKLLRNGFVDMVKIFMSGPEKLNLEKDPEYLQVWLGTKISMVFKNIQAFVQNIKTFFNTTAKGSDKTRWEQIQDLVNAIYSTFVLAYSISRDIGEFAARLFDDEHLGPSIDSILRMISELGLAIRNLSSSSYEGRGLRVLFNQILTTIKPLTSAINRLIEGFSRLVIRVLHIGDNEDGAVSFWETLADVIDKVAGVITHIGAPIIDFFTSFIEVVGDLFQNGINSETLSKAGSTLKTAMKTMLDSVFSFIPNFSDKVKDFYQTVVAWFSGGFKISDWNAIVEKLRSAGTLILNSVPEGLKTGITNVYNRVKTILSAIWASITGFFSDSVNVFRNRFSGESIGQLRTNMKAIWSKVTLAIPEGVRTGAKGAFQKVVNFVKGLWDKFVGFFRKQFGGGGGKSANSKADGLVKEVRTYAMNLVAGSKDDEFKVQGKTIFDNIIDWFKDTFANLKASLQRLLGNVEGDAAAFKTTIAKVIEWFKSLDWEKITGYLVGIAGATVISVLVVKAVKIVKKLTKGVKNISDAISEGFASLKAPKKTETFGDKMLKFAAAIAIVTACLVVIGNMKTESVLQGGIAVAAVCGALLVMAVILKRMFKDTSVSEASAMLMSLVGISLAILLMSSALVKLAKIDPSRMQNVIWSFSAIIIGLIVVASVAKNGGLSFDQLGGALAFCAGLYLLITALLKVKNLKWEQLGKMGVTLAGILTMLLGFAYMLKRSKSSFSDTGLKEAKYLAGSVALLVISLIPLALLPIDKIAKALGALGIVLAMLYVFAKGINKNEVSLKDRGMSSIMALSIGLTLIMLSLVPVALLPFGKVLFALISVAAILGMLYMFIKAVNANEASMKQKGMIQLLAVSASITLIMLSLIPLALLPFNKVMGAVLAVVVIMGMLAGFTAIVGRMKSSLKGSGLIQLVALAAAIVAVVVALTPLALMSWDQIWKMLAGLVGILGMFSLVIAASKKMNAETAIASILTLVSLAAVMYVYAMALEKIPKGMNWETILAFAGGIAALLVGISAAAAIMGVVGIKGVLVLAAGITAIMAVIALMAPLVIGSIGRSLQEISAQLKLTGSMFSDFVASMRGFSTSELEDVKAKFDLLYDLIVGLHDVGSYISAVHSFSECMLLLGSGLGQFQYSTGKISDPKNSNGIKLLEKILSLKNDIAGFTGIQQAVVEIAYLGAGLSVFNETAGNITGTNEDAIGMLESILEFSGKLTGFGEAQSFATQIGQLGSGLSGFNTSISGITDGNPPALTLLSNILSYGSQLSGMTGAFSAAAKIGILGSGLSGFNTSVSGISNGSPEALTLLNNILGYSGKLSGFDTAETFSTQIGKIGSGLSGFNTSVSRISNGSPEALTLLSNLIGYSDQLSALKGASSAAIQIGLLGSSLSIFTTTTQDISDSNPKALDLLSNMAGNATSLEKLVGLDLTSFGDTMAGLGGALAIYARGVKEASGIEIGEIPDVSGAIMILSSLTEGLADEFGDFNIPNMPEDDEITHFGVQLAALAGGLIEFADASQGLGDNTQKALDVLTFMKDLKADLTAQNVELFKVFGEAGVNMFTLTSFGIDINALGSSLKNYSENTRDFVKNQQALDVLDFMIDLKGKLNKENLKLFSIFGEANVGEASFTSFGTDIGALSSSLSDYSKNTKDFVRNQQALDVLDFMVDLKEKLNTENLKVFGIFTEAELAESSFTAFGNDINALGSSLKGYSDNTKDFVKSQKALDVLDFMVDLKGKLNKENLKLFDIFGDAKVGEASFTSFGNDINALGSSLKGYSDNTKDFVKNKQALDVLDFMIDLNERLDISYIKMFNLFGEAGVHKAKFTEFGTDIAALGGSMASYSKSTEGFKKNQDALDAIDFFYDLQGKLLKSSIDTAIFSFFAGTTPETLTQFGTDISALGDALGKFAASVSFNDDETADFDQAIKSLDVLSKISQELPKYGGIRAIWEGSKQTLSDLATDVTVLGEGLSALSDSLAKAGQNSGTSFNSDLVNSALETVQAIAEIATTFAMMGDDMYLYDGYYAVRRINETVNAMAGLIADVDENYPNSTETFIDNLVQFMKAFENATNEYGGFEDISIFEAFKNIAIGIKNMASVDISFDMKPLGLNMTAGLAEGIREGGSDVIDAMVEVALASYEAAKTALDSNSPSRLFIGLGEYVSEGFAIGIQNEDRQVEKAGLGMVDTAADATNRFLSSLENLLGDDIDMEPTIRPVLDLSDVQSGVNRINGLLGQANGSDIAGNFRDAAAYSREFAQVVASRGQFISPYGDMTETLNAMKDAAGITADALQTTFITRMAEQNAILSDKLNNLRVYLDTGALVGGVSDGVDRNIGRSSFYERRNN